MFDFQTRGKTDLTSSKLFIFIALRSYLCMWNNVNDIFYSDEHLVKWFHFPSNIILGNDIRNKISPLLWQLVHGFRTLAPVRYLLLSIKSRDLRMKEHPLKSMKIATKMTQVPTKMFLESVCFNLTECIFVDGIVFDFLFSKLWIFPPKKSGKFQS